MEPLLRSAGRLRSSSPVWRFGASCLLGCIAAAESSAQGSAAALRFFPNSQGGQDRVVIVVDDDQPGVNASRPADVGGGSFTLEFWLRGEIQDNATSNLGGDREVLAAIWKQGNVLLDREIPGPNGAEFGVSVAGGFVRFGTGRGASAPFDPDHTLEGNVNVLDGAWHHVACVRDALTGTKSIYVDGALDFESSSGVSRADLSWPDAGGASSGAIPALVLAADGADGVQAAAPQFGGFFDELRLWSAALTRSQILSRFDRVLPSIPPELALWLRFEEGTGTIAADSSNAGNPAAQVIAGQPANGAWTSVSSGTNAVAPISPGMLPAGFQRTTLTEALTQPTALEFLPDGRLLIAERGGTIRSFQNGVLAPTPVLQVAVDTTNGERGVLGLAAHPQFATNGYLYVFHTTLEPRDRVSRFTVVGNVALPSSEVVIWQAPTLASDFHHGGAIELTADGKLYIAVGDQLNSSNAQDVSVPFGKLLRLDADGAIPLDNPFLGVGGALPEIFATGLRNPFRFALDVDGTIYLGDVGGNTVGSAEELDRIVPGANLGWPHQEGASCYASDCSAFSFPLWTYRHDDPNYYLLNPQGSITAGPIYRANRFPPSFHGNIFVGDYANRWLRRLILDEHGNVVADPIFLWTGLGRTPVDIEIGPDGALYYLSFGVPYGGFPDQAALFRIDWIGTTNQVPIPVAAATPTSGSAPLAVQFSSAGTADPDAGPAPLSWSWSFGDGQFSTAPNPQHSFAQNGRYTVLLTVSDGAQVATADPWVIEVGTPPIPSIGSPSPSASYIAGQRIAFQGGAADGEDGVLPASALSWEVLLVHSEHVHPFLGPLSGVASGSFEVPDSGHAPSGTHFVIRLTATDSDGLVGSTSVALYPDVSAIALATQPSGIPLALDGEPVSTPVVEFSLDGFHHALEAPLAHSFGNQTLVFRCWSDGGDAMHPIVAPSGGVNLTAQYDLVVPVEQVMLVPAGDRNAQFQASTGVKLASPSAPVALTLGRDARGGIETAFEFASPLPPHALVISAALELHGTGVGFGQPACAIRGFDVGNASPFLLDSAIALSDVAPLTGASITWAIPQLASNQLASSPDLATILQEIVDRADYQSGNFIGVMLDGKGNTLAHHHDVWRFGTAYPPRLRVKYVVPTSGSGACDPPCGFTTIPPPGTKAADRLGLVGSGSTSPGGTAQVIACGLGDATAAVLLVAPTAATAPFMGGTLLVGLGGFLVVVTLPVSEGSTSLPIPILASPQVVGVQLVFQAVTADSSQLVGVALSNGLRLVICP